MLKRMCIGALLTVVPLCWAFQTSAAEAKAPTLVILRAIYEAVDGSGKADVTEKVKSHVREGRLSLQVSNDALGGDPFPQKPKRLRVECTIDGKPQTLVVNEGESIAIPAPPPPSPEEELAKAMATLKSAEATQKEKADACRALQRLGTKDAVAALAALLPDEKLSHMARYALEAIPDPAADAALRDALDKTKGRELAGVIHSIGMRRDAKAVPLLAKFIGDADKDVAAIAAAAIGRIGTPEAAKVLEKAMANPTWPICDGALRCADALLAAGQAQEAIRLYELVRDSKTLPYVRAGAVRGIVRAKGAEGPAFLAEQLRSPDLLLYAAMLHLVQSELPGKEFTDVLVAELPKQTGERKTMLIQALGCRGDEAAVPALATAASSGEKAVRLSAISALAQVATPAVAAPLAKLAEDADEEIAKAAREALASLPGKDTDALYLGMLESPDATRKLMGIQMVARRRVRAAAPALLKLVAADDDNLRSAALQALRELATEAELPALLDLLAKAKPGADTDALTQAISAVCRSAAQPDAAAEKVIAAITTAQPTTKIALLRVLGAVGGVKALQAVRSAVGDPDEKVKAAAIRCLATWRDAAAAKDLVELAKTLPNANDRLLCIQGCLALAGNQQLSAAERLAVCRQVAPLIQRDEEKKLLLGTLGGIADFEAIAEIQPHLENAATKAEAGMAILNVADKLLQPRQPAANARKLVPILQKLADTAPTPEIGERAKMLLRKAQGPGARK